MSELERYRKALVEIADHHGQHASICMGRDWSWVLGWAQGIAREALGRPQNDFTRRQMELRATREGRLVTFEFMGTTPPGDEE